MLQNQFIGIGENLADDLSEYGIDWNGPVPSVESNTVIVNEPGNILNDNQYLNLISRVNPL